MEVGEGDHRLGRDVQVLPRDPAHLTKRHREGFAAPPKARRISGTSPISTMPVALERRPSNSRLPQSERGGGENLCPVSSPYNRSGASSLGPP